MRSFCLVYRFNFKSYEVPSVRVSVRPWEGSGPLDSTRDFIFLEGIMSQEQAVRQEAFEDLQLQIIEQDGEEWFKAEDIGKALGLADPRPSVIRIFNRNRDEFEGLYRVVSLTTWLKTGGQRPYRSTTFNPQGAYLLAILARTPKSKALRRFLAKFMAHDLLRLKEGVAQLEAQHEADRKEMALLRKTVNRQAKELSVIRPLVRASIALPAPELPPLPEMKTPVLIDFNELRRLFEYGREGFPVNFLHQVIDRNAAAPTFHLEVKLPGAHRQEPFLVLTGCCETKLLP